MLPRWSDSATLSASRRRALSHRRRLGRWDTGTGRKSGNEPATSTWHAFRVEACSHRKRSDQPVLTLRPNKQSTSIVFSLPLKLRCIPTWEVFCIFTTRLVEPGKHLLLEGKGKSRPRSQRGRGLCLPGQLREAREAGRAPGGDSERDLLPTSKGGPAGWKPAFGRPLEDHRRSSDSFWPAAEGRSGGCRFPVRASIVLRGAAGPSVAAVWATNTEADRRRQCGMRDQRPGGGGPVGNG